MHNSLGNSSLRRKLPVMRFNESTYHNPAEMDFVPRERRGQITQLIAAFLIALVLIFVLGFVMAKSLGAIGVFAAMGVITVLCIFVVMRKQQNLDLVMNTEYQNMLFSQAVALGSSFCLFARRDGTVVYSNDGLRKLFPDMYHGESHALDTIFERGQVGRPERERVMAAVYSGKAERVILTITSHDNTTQDYIITIEPLERPGEFLVIRGREYRDTRAGTQILPDALRATTADKIDHMLAKTPVAFFTTDEFGAFEYVNPAFEQMLGYAAGELVENRLGLNKVLFQLNGTPVTDYTLADFRGDALLQKKQSDLASVRLQIAVIRDDQGKAQGATASALMVAGPARNA